VLPVRYLPEITAELGAAQTAEIAHSRPATKILTGHIHLSTDYNLMKINREGYTAVK
jgi:hypothetical protein